jgi:hypothetical protein
VDEGVSDVVAGQVAGEHRAGRDWPVAGDVLHAVHREIGPPLEQRLVDLAGERALAAERGQCALPPVTAGRDRENLDLDVRGDRGELGSDPFDLGQGHR